MTIHLPATWTEDDGRVRFYVRGTQILSCLVEDLSDLAIMTLKGAFENEAGKVDNRWGMSSGEKATWRGDDFYEMTGGELD